MDEKFVDVSILDSDIIFSCNVSMLSSIIGSGAQKDEHQDKLTLNGMENFKSYLQFGHIDFGFQLSDRQFDGE